ncbi:hypothetical protein BpHYR1_029241 [Brachionus plicatilis]|uniref:Uncharacterized protein n=1 Tax=Brachionus plicatilis TaxID=10195 RepID=A0A3M7RC80_BRAPC|nr:hypothetical protein BpHYR1_029241 [Brachionus plicatilis]
MWGELKLVFQKLKLGTHQNRLLDLSIRLNYKVSSIKHLLLAIQINIIQFNYLKRQKIYETAIMTDEWSFFNV